MCPMQKKNTVIAGTKMPLPKKLKTDNFGSGIKNPEGKEVRSYMNAAKVKPNKLKVPPKKLA